MYIYRIVGLLVAFQIPALCICSDGLVTMAADDARPPADLLQAHPDTTMTGQQHLAQSHQQHQHHDSPTLSNQSDQQRQLTDDYIIRASVREAEPTSANPHLQATRDDRGRLDLKTFRLEFNKFKILSHLGITADPAELNPQLGDELRTQLTAATLFNNANFDSGSPNSGARHKRSLSCDQVNANKSTCCLENFYVNFTTIGWDKWILYPAGYNANYCRGQCDLSHARYYHSTLLSKYNNFVSLCCSPRQVAPLRLLYIDEDNKVHQKSIPDMIVESCDCA